MAFIKKRLSTLILITVLLCSGLIYANVQAASTLTNWYTQKFQKEDEKKTTTAETEIWTTFKQLGSFISEAKENATTAIEKSRKKQVEESKMNIETVVTDIKQQLNQTVTDLEKENFDEYVENRNIEGEIEDEVATILEEILGE